MVYGLKALSILYLVSCDGIFNEQIGCFMTDLVYKHKLSTQLNLLMRLSMLVSLYHDSTLRNNFTKINA